MVRTKKVFPVRTSLPAHTDREKSLGTTEIFLPQKGAPSGLGHSAVAAGVEVAFFPSPLAIEIVAPSLRVMRPSVTMMSPALRPEETT